MANDSTRASAFSRDRLADILVSVARLALALTIVTLPWRQRLMLVTRPSPPIYADFTNILLHTHTIILATTLLFWGASLAARPRPINTGPFFLFWPIMGVTATAVISAAASASLLLAAAHAVQVALLALLYLFLVNEIKGLRAIIWAVGLQLGIQAMIGFAQSWQQHDLGLGWLGERMLDPAGGSSFVWAEGGLRALRAYGLSDHPNILAAGLAFGLLLLTTWLATSNSRWRMAGVALFGLTCGALFLTFSRPAWIAAAVGMLVAGWLWQHARPRPVERSVIIAAALATTLFLLPLLFAHLPYLRLGSNPPVIAARIEEKRQARAARHALNTAANQLFSHHAVTGVGIGVMPLAALQMAPDLGVDFQPARNTVLTAAAEVGLFGVMFYVAALLSPWAALALRRERLRTSPTLIGLSGALAAVTVLNAFDAYAWYYPSGRVWQWLIWGLWAASFYQPVSDTLDRSFADTP
ncbi:MAG: O-antigen ligase family protein [Anaerolineae bacterium]